MDDISKSELEILHVIWRTSPISTNDIVDTLQASHGWHDKTTRTLITRLVKKQAVSFEKVGRQYFYTPLIDQDTYLASQSKSFLQRVFKGNFIGLVSGFAKSESLSRDDIEQLKQFIDDWEKKND
ncbi:BlaI/MecI/CopY family transcriptional regulator [uncultured Umboniibacter sp.]|uniref:BlaI/MecI/CopY family transcriptional regulator n=1 Tax=uncultured Umboniibacter sp. TaxID=1798917 RepID=UPI00261B7A10|nr:BlaI/MecI/CopY family transcriptional regulator [uncultured Umboniibacter sp.]